MNTGEKRMERGRLFDPVSSPHEHRTTTVWIFGPFHECRRPHRRACLHPRRPRNLLRFRTSLEKGFELMPLPFMVGASSRSRTCDSFQNVCEQKIVLKRSSSRRRSSNRNLFRHRTRGWSMQPNTCSDSEIKLASLWNMTLRCVGRLSSLGTRILTGGEPFVGSDLDRN